MARKKKRKKKSAGRGPSPAPELSGIALLLVESPVEKLDLHGMTAREAETRVRLFFQRHATTSAGRVAHVITGKGTRSVGAPVLPGVVRDMLEGELEDIVAEWAALHGGGGFAVRIG